MAQMGALITDFMLIKPGMLHRANGGYLILDALKVLTSPYAWEGLKRALQFRQIRIESPLQMLSLTSTVSLEPEPVPLDVKVILLGDRMLYYLLSEADPDFNELFKVAADFADELVRDDETDRLYAQLVAQIAERGTCGRWTACAVGRVAGSCCPAGQRFRAHDHQHSGDRRPAAGGRPLRPEAAGHDSAPNMSRRPSTSAFSALTEWRTLLQEEVLRETINVQTQGEVVGQINGLSVLQLGTSPFGQASRITPPYAWGVATWSTSSARST